MKSEKYLFHSNNSTSIKYRNEQRINTLYSSFYETIIKDREILQRLE
jgi:hypothetical protein